MNGAHGRTTAEAITTPMRTRPGRRGTRRGRRWLAAKEALLASIRRQSTTVAPVTGDAGRPPFARQ